ncbi:type II secretion system protein, partial [Planctomycetota bacterium]
KNTYNGFTPLENYKDPSREYCVKMNKGPRQPYVKAVRASDSLTGFTLIEILVSIAIIGILASILLPVLSSARNSARLVNCSSNLRQVGFGFHMYAIEFAGAIPHEDNGDTQPPFDCGWYILIKEYSDNDTVFLCPSEIHEKKYFSYKMNSKLETEKKPFFDIDRGCKLGQTILVFDGRIDNKGVRSAPKGTWNMVSDRHGKPSNILFLDNHVESVIREFDAAGWTDKNGLIWDPILSW